MIFEHKYAIIDIDNNADIEYSIDNEKHPGDDKVQLKIKKEDPSIKVVIHHKDKREIFEDIKIVRATILKEYRTKYIDFNCSANDSIYPTYRLIKSDNCFDIKVSQDGNITVVNIAPERTNWRDI